MENNKNQNKAPEQGAGKSGGKNRRPHHHRPHKKPEQKAEGAQVAAQAAAPEQAKPQKPAQKPQKPQGAQPKAQQPQQQKPAEGKGEGGGRKRPRHRGGRGGRDKEKTPQAQEPTLQLPADISIAEIKEIVEQNKRAQTAPVKEESLPLADASILESIPTHSTPVYNPDEPLTEVVGVRFKDEGKVYYFAPGAQQFAKGDAVIVETARGPEYGTVWVANRQVRDSEIIKPLKEVMRRATAEDKKHNQENKAREAEAFRICGEKIAHHGLDMKLVEAQYTFDNSKLLFYFTSAGRVDFRELVKDLASVFRTRIELRQIGIRDEAKLMGGLGACGRPLCCATFLSDFGQVSIKMAKEQNLSLNSSKISGVCGRLMCCLRYEHEAYVEEIKLTPPVDSVVKTPDGVGTVVETMPLRGLLKVKLKDTEGAPITVHRDQVKVLSRPNRRNDDDENE